MSKFSTLIVLTAWIVVAHTVPAVFAQEPVTKPPRSAVVNKAEKWHSMQTSLISDIEEAYAITAAMSNSNAHQVNLLLLAAGTVLTNGNRADFNTAKKCKKLTDPAPLIEHAKSTAARLADPSSDFQVSYDHYAVVEQILDLALQKFRRPG